MTWKNSGTGVLVFASAMVALTGCSLGPAASAPKQAGAAITGNVHGGQQPVAGARVYLLAAGTTGYGSAAVSLLNSGTAGADSIGGYVLTDASGSFSITGNYTCTQGQQVYALAMGGDPGAGVNTASGIMSAVGACPAAGNFQGAVPYIAMDEMSTVAFAWAVAGFGIDATHVGSSGTPLATVGIANAFANTANLMHGATPVGGNGTVPVAELHTLANILAACINSDGTVSGPGNPSMCYSLFQNATDGTNVPTETATAAFNIAHHPTANVAALFNLQTPVAPFAPSLSAVPADFSVAITFTGGGMVTSTAQINQTANTINNLAVDANGNIWKPNYGGNSLTELSPLGVPLSGTAGFTGGGLNQPQNIAVDLNGNVWTPNAGSSTISSFDASGTAVSGSPFGAGVLNAPTNVAIDAGGNVWVPNSSTLAELTSAGANVTGSPYATNTLNAPYGIAIQSNGNVWVSNAFSNTIAVYTNTGAAAYGSPFTQGGLAYPSAMGFDAGGYAWISEQSSVTRLNANGTNSSGSPFSSPNGTIPTGLTVDGGGNVWVTDVGSNAILELNHAGTYLSGTPGFQSSQSSIPEAVVVDGSGNVWYSTYNDATVRELVGAGFPTVTPLAYAVKNSLQGQRP